MELVHDVLDKQLVDREQRPMGKVDGLVLELRDGQPPRVAWIEVGVTTLAHRLGRRPGRWMERVAGLWGREFAKPLRLPFRAVRDIGFDVEVDVDARASGAMRWEAWWREHVIDRIPGARR